METEVFHPSAERVSPGTHSLRYHLGLGLRYHRTDRQKLGLVGVITNVINYVKFDDSRLKRTCYIYGGSNYALYHEGKLSCHYNFASVALLHVIRKWMI
jgi:hypothetical protein